MEKQYPKPKVDTRRYVVLITYPFWEFDKTFGENRTNNLSYAKKCFAKWVDRLKEDGLTAIIKLKEINKSPIRVCVVSAGQITELTSDEPVWEKMRERKQE